MKFFSDAIENPNSRVFVPVLGFYAKTRFVIFCFGFIGFIIPMIYGYINGFPVPHVQDELAYTVSADTYANGKLTNPTPAHFEHFETPHVLMEPSYVSKYPPMQGMFMAAGQVLFKHQIFGVWLSCGLMAASLFWMLLAWTKPNWAFVGTILMILFLGINSYWAQSYWGGMVAAAGGALFLGGFRRLFKKLSVGSTVWMTLGGIILVNSRPFEGTLTMLLPMLILSVWLLRDKKNQISKRFSQVVFPGIVLTVLALSAMCYQYYRVTGEAFTLPYSVHHKQYYPTPLFVFQPVNKLATRGNERIRKTYEGYTSPAVLDEFYRVDGIPDSLFLNSIFGLTYLFTFNLSFFLSPILIILLFFTLPILIRRSRWLLLIAAAIAFTFISMCFGIWWDQFHYCAPLTSCIFLLITEGLRQFYSSSKKGAERRFVLIALIGLVAGAFIYLQMFSFRSFSMEDDFSIEKSLIYERLSENEPLKAKIPVRAAFFKSEFENVVEKLPGKYIAVVSYDESYNYHDEMIYNKADIENSKIIWAHDLGAEKNKALLNYYNNRKVLVIKISGSTFEVNPLP